MPFPYFKELYDAAAVKDAVKIKQLLAEGASIDEHDICNDSTTVAGRLAKDGKIDAAKWLINYFGASVFYVYISLIQRNDLIEAEQLNNAFDSNIKDKIEVQDPEVGRITHSLLPPYNLSGLYHKFSFGDWFATDALSHLNEDRSLYILGDTQNPGLFQDNGEHRALRSFAAYGGHLAWLEQQNCTSGQDFIDMLVGSTHYRWCGVPASSFANEKLALHVLTFIQSDAYRENLVNALIRQNSRNMIRYDLLPLLEKARNIRTVMAITGCGYLQALGFVEKPDRDKMIELAKIQQVIQHYEFTEEEAQRWVTEPVFRAWFREFQFSLTKTLALPDELRMHLNMSMLDEPLQSANQFCLKLRHNVTHLPTVNYDPKLFGAPRATESDEPAPTLNVRTP